MLMSVINQNFEELMTHANVLNRKLEEVHGVGKEFSTVAELWGVSRSRTRRSAFVQ
jgi:DASH complex subunit DAD1